MARMGNRNRHSKERVAVKNLDPITDKGEPSRETRNVHPDDKLLRDHGFHILSRPRLGPNRWERTGEAGHWKGTEAEAWAIVMREVQD